METLILITDVVEKIVLAGLVLLSIASITVVIERRKFYRQWIAADFNSLYNEISGKSQVELQQFFLNKKDFFSEIFAEAMSANSSQSFERKIAAHLRLKKIQLEQGLSFLASLGSNAPFIGLFGTVLGIIRAFAYLGSQSGASAVMTGVSQALYATAIGLLVAIPAVLAYNFYSQKIRKFHMQVESLRDLLLARFLFEQKKADSSWQE